MKETIREAPLGQVIRFISRNKLLRYPEEEPGFQIPFEKLISEKKLDEINKEYNAESPVLTPSHEAAESEKAEKPEETEASQFEPISHAETAEDGHDVDIESGQRRDLNKLTSVKTVSRTETTPYTRERYEAERELADLRTKSLPIEPIITSSGQILVTWYTTDDQANPQNWSQRKKGYVACLIW
jgi:MFS transporter, DHA1 family, multidrug resistance protein